jgi:hypothetical protein
VLVGRAMESLVAGVADERVDEIVADVVGGFLFSNEL